MKKHQAAPLEFSFAVEAFNLELVTTADGDHQAAETRQREQDRQAAESQQPDISHLTPSLNDEPHC